MAKEYNIEGGSVLHLVSSRIDSAVPVTSSVNISIDCPATATVFFLYFID